jgi:hypothetical protein
MIEIGEFSFRVFGNSRWLSLLLLVAALSGCSETTGGGEPRLDLQPGVLDFGTVPLGWEKQLTVEIANRGDGLLQIFNVSVDASDTTLFSITSALSFSLTSGDTDRIQIRFAPKVAGTASGVLRVTTNAGTSSVGLKGIGRAIGAGNDVVIASLVATSPVVDGDGSDLVWSFAPATPLTFSQVFPEPQLDTFSTGSRRSPFNGEIRAVYTTDSVYFLIRYADPIAEMTPDRWTLIGSDPSSDWKRETSGEDGVSLIFPITSTVEGHNDGETFTTAGCAATCHAASSLDNYEGGHYPRRGAVDIWYWRAGVAEPFGRADDQVAFGSDMTPVTSRRIPDSESEPAAPNFHAGQQGAPLFMAGGDNGGFDRERYLWGPTAIPFDPAMPNPSTLKPWKIGDNVFGWRAYEPSGDRAQVRARGRQDAGGWTLELARALDTQSANDISFDIRQVAYFGLAVHDNQRKFSQDEYRALPSLPSPSHYGVPLMQLIFN